MSERAPYSRVYWAIVDDPKFAAIYDDDRHLATWLRLLMAADGLWPASCPIPATARKSGLVALTEAGLIDVLPGGRFRIHGLDAERGRRRDAARTPPKRVPDGDQTVPERPPHAGARLGSAQLVSAQLGSDPFDDPEADVVTWLAKHGCALQPHSGYYRHVVTMVESHGVNAVVGMLDRLASAGTKSGDVKGYVFGARDALDAQTRPNLADVGKADRADADARAHQARLDRTQRELRALREVGS